MPTFEAVDFNPFAASTIPPQGRALLDTIAGSESPGYDTIYGGGKFDNFADHPRQSIPITSGPNAGRTSSAAGRYQFLGSTWDQVKNEAGLPDFSPESQDQGAWYLANKVYNQKTGRDLASDLTSAKGNPAAIAGIGRYLSGTWTSLPGGIEPNKATGSFTSRYASAQPSTATEFSAQSRAPQFTPVDHDPFAQPAPVQHNTEGLSDRVAREGLSEPAPPPSTFAEKLGKLWENPPPNGIVGTVKPIIQGIGTLMQAAHGDIPMVGPDGRTNPVVIEGSFEAAKGLTPLGAAPINPNLVRAIASFRPPAATPKAAVPTIEELKGAATAGYESQAVKDLAIEGSAVRDLSATIQADLNKMGVDENLAPKTFGILGKLEKAPQGALATGDNLNSIRRIFGNAASSSDATERLAAKNAIDALDTFMAKLPENRVVSGDAQTAAQTLETARGNYAAAMRASSIDKKTIQAELRSAAANSGQNVANTVRQRMADILLKPAELRGYTMAERAQMEKIVRGTAAENALRFTGNLLGGGGGLGAMTSATIGAYATGGPGAIAPAVGYALKQISNRMTLKQAAQLSEMVRSRAPLANAMTDFGTKAQAFQAAQNPQTISAIALAARNLSNNLKDAGFSISPANLMQSLRGPMPATAEQDQ